MTKFSCFSSQETCSRPSKLSPRQVLLSGLADTEIARGAIIGQQALPAASGRWGQIAGRTPRPTRSSGPRTDRETCVARAEFVSERKALATATRQGRFNGRHRRFRGLCPRSWNCSVGVGSRGIGVPPAEHDLGTAALEQAVPVAVKEASG